MKRVIVAVLTLAIVTFVLAGCDRGARKDLPQDDQTVTEGDADVILMPDQFPNLVHRCIETTGIWTTTADYIWIVYDDPRCGAPASERPSLVLDNIPGGVTP